MPVSQVARRAIVDFLVREEPSFGQPNLPLLAERRAVDREESSEHTR